MRIAHRQRPGRSRVEALRRVVRASPAHEVAWIARDGAEAVAQCARRPAGPDPDGPGHAAAWTASRRTRRIMAATPCPILVVTSTRRAATVSDGLRGDGPRRARRGRHADARAGRHASTAARAAAQDRHHRAQARDRARRRRRRRAPQQPQRPRVVPPLVAIGASTGGPAAWPSCSRPARRHAGGGADRAAHRPRSSRRAWPTGSAAARRVGLAARAPATVPPGHVWVAAARRSPRPGAERPARLHARAARSPCIARRSTCCSPGRTPAAGRHRRAADRHGARRRAGTAGAARGRLADVRAGRGVLRHLRHWLRVCGSPPPGTPTAPWCVASQSC